MDKITYPKGFLLHGFAAGIKKEAVLDMGLIYSEVPCQYTGLFTTNNIVAAPVKICKEKLNQPIQALVVNSKGANSFTGKRGYNDAKEMTSLVEQQLNLKESSVLVASTGVIGEYLPMDKIRKGILELCQAIKNKKTDPSLFAQSILTTDTKTKEFTKQIEINGKTVTLYGCCKGSGMIFPNMATMLAFVISDVDIDANLLRQALIFANDRSFNAITVDGDRSTNDCILLLSNGLAQNEKISQEDKGYELFKNALTELCLHLSQDIVRDGEGATKFVEICVKGAQCQDDANKCAFHIANSLLVKTAFFGQDANWGRFVYAVGASGCQVDEEKLDMALGSIQLVKNGERTQFTNDEANHYMKNHDLYLEVNLNLGSFTKTVYTTDISYDYVKIKADYRS